jgi:hypothetical protein
MWQLEWKGQARPFPEHDALVTQMKRYLPLNAFLSNVLSKLGYS